MKRRIGATFAFILFSLVPCFAHHLAVVVNKDNNVGEVSAAHLSRIFQSEVKKWPDGKDVVLVLHKSSSGEMATLERLNKMSAAQFKSFVDAHKDSILMVNSDAELLTLIQSTPGAIGLVEVRSIDDRVNVVRVDGKLPMEDGYLPH
jgi:ABC-type phosphate transport system substrate-binding protein